MTRGGTRMAQLVTCAGRGADTWDTVDFCLRWGAPQGTADSRLTCGTCMRPIINGALIYRHCGAKQKHRRRRVHPLALQPFPRAKRRCADDRQRLRALALPGAPLTPSRSNLAEVSRSTVRETASPQGRLKQPIHTSGGKRVARRLNLKAVMEPARRCCGVSSFTPGENP